MEFPKEAIALTDEVRETWALARKMHGAGHKQVVNIVGPKSARAAMALAALEGVPVTIFPADGVTSNGDWYSVELLTRVEGLPNGTIARPRSGTWRVPTILPNALAQGGDHIVVIHGIDRVPYVALNGLRPVLDPTHPQVPTVVNTKPVPPETFIVLAADELPDEHRAVLVGRIDIVIRLPG